MRSRGLEFVQRLLASSQGARAKEEVQSSCTSCDLACFKLGRKLQV